MVYFNLLIRLIKKRTLIKLFFFIWMAPKFSFLNFNTFIKIWRCSNFRRELKQALGICNTRTLPTFLSLMIRWKFKCNITWVRDLTNGEVGELNQAILSKLITVWICMADFTRRLGTEICWVLEEGCINLISVKHPPGIDPSTLAVLLVQAWATEALLKLPLSPSQPT